MQHGCGELWRSPPSAGATGRSPASATRRHPCAPLGQLDTLTASRSHKNHPSRGRTRAAGSVRRPSRQPHPGARNTRSRQTFFGFTLSGCGMGSVVSTLARHSSFGFAHGFPAG